MAEYLSEEEKQELREALAQMPPICDRLKRVHETAKQKAQQEARTWADSLGADEKTEKLKNLTMARDALIESLGETIPTSAFNKLKEVHKPALEEVTQEAKTWADSLSTAQKMEALENINLKRNALDASIGINELTHAQRIERQQSSELNR